MAKVEKQINVELARSYENGTLVVNTTLTEERKSPYLTDKDAIGKKEETRYLRSAEGVALTGGAIISALGGLELIITGFASGNINDIEIGAGAFVLSYYFGEHAQDAFRERRISIEELKKIKQDNPKLRNH